MNGRELGRQPLTGGLNTNYFVDSQGREALLRVPRGNKDLFENIVYEYQYIGFTADAGRVRRRSPQEQFDFSWKAAKAGLLVLPPLAIDGDNITYPFLSQAQTLDEYFRYHRSDQHVLIYKLIADLQKAHSLGFVYGDRWSGNMLVDPQLGLVHIDFDLKISGRTAVDLDVAQVFYHTLWAGGDEVLPLLALMLGTSGNWFDFAKTSKYMLGFAKFLSKTPVGGIGDKTEELIGVADMIRSKN